MALGSMAVIAKRLGSSFSSCVSSSAAGESLSGLSRYFRRRSPSLLYSLMWLCSRTLGPNRKVGLYSMTGTGIEPRNMGRLFEPRCNRIAPGLLNYVS
jgi:hypothetical protein